MNSQKAGDKRKLDEDNAPAVHASQSQSKITIKLDLLQLPDGILSRTCSFLGHTERIIFAMDVLRLPSCRETEKHSTRRTESAKTSLNELVLVIWD
jgi:hypothetical protein